MRRDGEPPLSAWLGLALGTMAACGGNGNKTGGATGASGELAGNNVAASTDSGGTAGTESTGPASSAMGAGGTRAAAVTGEAQTSTSSGGAHSTGGTTSTTSTGGSQAQGGSNTSGSGGSGGGGSPASGGSGGSSDGYDYTIDPAALVGCRSPEQDACLECCLGETESGDCNVLSGDLDWSQFEATPWYAISRTDPGPCPENCPPCAQCTIRNEAELRALEPLPEGCDCETVVRLGDDCYTPAACACRCIGAEGLTALCPAAM